MNWYSRRVLQAILTVYAVLVLSFVFTRVLPGNAGDILRARLEDEGGMSSAEIDRQVERFMNMHPDDPIHVAFVDYMINVHQLDLGQSIWYGQSVNELIAVSLPWTLFIVSWGLFFSFFVGIVLGSVMAYYEGSKIDVGLTSYGMLAGSIPYYVFAIFLLIALSYRTGYFPTSGRVGSGLTPGFNWPFIRSVIHHATLPTLSIVLSGSIASFSMRGNSIRVLGADYIRVARLRGLPDRTIITQYVVRNAVLPMYTGFMISIGNIFGGVIILEMVFGYQGMGYYMAESVNTRDYPLMMGVFMVITVAVVVALLIADLTYPKLDPRIDASGEEL
ncbi:ABC transporter permease [Natronorubrum tibetense]|uniref:ABC transporter integral membrane subunit n=1 Tax=Natronorubrum tibetense GA33 TaxID=1114856 RepID=L9VXQ1_9EURY|nr:ABC transporter permease [Natronorubrum tibetense]ELY41796.1 ABC transporter integral membrane subunit [Natronorubrum tibetense GA33]